MGQKEGVLDKNLGVLLSPAGGENADCRSKNISEEMPEM